MALQDAGWSSLVARQAHNLKAAGSNPAPATNAMKLYRVYVLQNPYGQLYIGISENLEVRIRQHNAGASSWTKGKGPWKLVWQSEAISLSDARKLENRLKRQGRGKGFYSNDAITSISLIIRQLPDRRHTPNFRR
jgi:putative endonuclease